MLLKASSSRSLQTPFFDTWSTGRNERKIKICASAALTFDVTLAAIALRLESLAAGMMASAAGGHPRLGSLMHVRFEIQGRGIRFLKQLVMAGRAVVIGAFDMRRMIEGDIAHLRLKDKLVLLRQNAGCEANSKNNGCEE